MDDDSSIETMDKSRNNSATVKESTMENTPVSSLANSSFQVVKNPSFCLRSPRPFQGDIKLGIYGASRAQVVRALPETLPTQDFNYALPTCSKMVPRTQLCTNVQEEYRQQQLMPFVAVSPSLVFRRSSTSHSHVNQGSVLSTRKRQLSLDNSARKDGHDCTDSCPETLRSEDPIINNEDIVKLPSQIDLRGSLPPMQIDAMLELPSQVDLNSSLSREETDPQALHQIYQQALDLFSTQKINWQNAFSIKLLECIGEVLQLDKFQSRNLHESGKLLEIGGKIYVCRVDFTHTETLKLAQEVGMNSKSLAKPRRGEADECQNLEGESNQIVTPVVKRKALRKRGRHLKSEESLEMDFNNARRVQDRREAFEEIMDDWIANDEEFRYDEFMHSYNLSAGSKRSSSSIDTSTYKVPFSLHVVNREEMSVIISYPFYFHKPGVWNSEAFDEWGRLFPAYNPEDFNLAERPGSCAHHFEYLSQKHFGRNGRMDVPGPSSATSESHQHEDLVEAADDFGYTVGEPVINENNEVRPMNFKKLTSLKQLETYFLELRKADRLGKEPNAKGCWEGPAFTNGPGNHKKKRGRKRIPKGKEKDCVVLFDEIDWRSNENRYILNGDPEELVTDEHYRRTTVYGKDIVEHMFEDSDHEENHKLPSSANEDKHIDSMLRCFIYNGPSNSQSFVKSDTPDLLNGNMVCEDHAGSVAIPYADAENNREFRMSDQPVNVDAQRGRGLTEGEANASLLNMYYSVALKSFVSCFPNPVPGQPTIYEQTDGNGFRISNQPKPINIRYLKNKIVEILSRELRYDAVDGPLLESETSVQLFEFVDILLMEVDENTRNYLSVSIIFVAILHVVVENKFLLQDQTGTLMIVCKGKNPSP